MIVLLGASAWAGSISAAGVLGGPDGNAATPGVAAIHYNPAAMAGLAGAQVLLDAQVAAVRLDVTTTRNDGIDPNTDAPYSLAKARVQVPVAVVGVAVPVIEDRLVLGLAVTDAFVGGGDYTAGEPDLDPPYESHQRYAGVQTSIITAHLIPSAAVTLMDGLHVGAGLKVILDIFEATQASDPLHTEGLGPDGAYSSDTVLTASTNGMHLGFNAGVYFDRFKKAQLGVSFHRNGTFEGEGEGSVLVSEQLGGGEADALITFEAKLPDVVYAWVNSELSERVTVGAGVEAQLWGACCGDRDGDIIIGVTSADGDPLGVDPEDGLGIEVAATQYSPRRLDNVFNFGANVGAQLHDRWWGGLRLAYNPNAVPDFAVSATNLDFENVGGVLALRSQVHERLTVGVSYAKFFLKTREITNSAWDAADDSPDFVDNRFSPSLPFKASTNGRYSGKVDIVGLRTQLDF